LATALVCLVHQSVSTSSISWHQTWTVICHSRRLCHQLNCHVLCARSFTVAVSTNQTKTVSSSSSSSYIRLMTVDIRNFYQRNITSRQIYATKDEIKSVSYFKSVQNAFLFRWLMIIRIDLMQWFCH